MSIYKKLAHIQCELLKKDIKKSGYNQHKHFKYHELEDLIPPIFEECMKQELTLVFTFVENATVLKLRDWNGKDEISVRITQPELVVPEKNPNNQLIQAVGANATYLKRYLLVNTFLITGEEVIDSDGNASSAVNQSKNETSDKPDKKEEPEVADLPMGKLVLEAKQTLEAKGLTEKEITYKALKNTILRMKQWSVPERRCILNYFKEKGGSK